MNVIAIIPARSGSKSVKDKNIVQLGGHPIIAYSIAAAKLSNLVQRIIVSTDSQAYAEIATQYGAEVPFIRPQEYSTDTSTDRDFLVHAMQWFKENEGECPEYWVHLRPTTPLRDPAIIDEAILQIMSDQNATSLRSGFKAPESPLKWFTKDEWGYFQGLIADSNESYNLPKEAFDEVYVPDGYVDVLKHSYIDSGSQIHGDKMVGFESTVSTDVDSIEELDYIAYQLEKNGSKLKDYLDSVLEKQ